jgi:hypothetical protein
MTTYKNEITKELFKAIAPKPEGVLFQNIKTGEKKLYTNWQIQKFITPLN